jgi:hypothetical protein
MKRLNVATTGCRTTNLTRGFPRTSRSAYAMSRRSAGLVIGSVSRQSYVPLFIHEAVIFISAINKARTYLVETVMPTEC